MPPDVYYQVKVVVPSSVFDKTIPIRNAAAKYLRDNSLRPYHDDAVEVRLMEADTSFFIITAWVKDELCENYKPRGSRNAATNN